MKKSNLIVLMIVGIYLFSCNPKPQNEKKETVCDSIEMSASEHLVAATLWFQKSAEMHAMYYQCYSYAKTALDNQLKKQKTKSKNAVVLDIDETVLDNSPYQGMLIQKGLTYTSETWRSWTKLAQAKALPGVVEFTNYAKSKGVEVFYVSNRDDDEREATIRNLNNEKLPCADEKHVYLRVNKVSSKMLRFEQIAKEYQILLFVGDNLGDFEQVFEKRTNNFGFKDVDSLKHLFGERYIMLPNPMYGEWEKTIYNGEYPNAKKRNELRKNALQSF